jgi:CO/xanthine dehydrogenase FAD-binding subunit
MGGAGGGTRGEGEAGRSRMSLHPQYARPRTLAETTSLLAQLNAGATIIAGGQELMPHVNHGRLMPDVFVDITALAELKGISEVDGGLSIGALTVHRELQDSPLVAAHTPLLAAAAAEIGGGWQVHNRGTVGGNVAALHPLYDLIPPLLALDAVLEIHGADGVTHVPLAAHAAGRPFGLGTRAVLARILVPAAPGGSAYRKLKITDGSYGSANAAARVVCDGAGAVAAARIVLGAVSERPIDVALDVCVGKPAGRIDLAAVEAACCAAVRTPLEDRLGDGAYRRGMAGIIGRRAFEAALSSRG